MQGTELSYLRFRQHNLQGPGQEEINSLGTCKVSEAMFFLP